MVQPGSDTGTLHRVAAGQPPDLTSWPGCRGPAPPSGVNRSC